MNWRRLKNLFIGGFLSINLLLAGIRVLVDLPPVSEAAIAVRTLAVLNTGGIAVHCDIPWGSAATAGIPETGSGGIDRDKTVDALGMEEDEASRSLVFIGASTFEYFDAGLGDTDGRRHIRTDDGDQAPLLLNLLREMGITHMDFAADTCPPDILSYEGKAGPGTGTEDDGAVFCLTGRLPGGMRSFDDQVLARFDRDGVLVYLRVQLSGILGEKDRVPVIPAYKILLAGESNYLTLNDVALGYHRITGSPAPSPVWRLVTDDGIVYFDAFTGRDVSPEL